MDLDINSSLSISDDSQQIINEVNRGYVASDQVHLTLDSFTQQDGIFSAASQKFMKFFNTEILQKHQGQCYRMQYDDWLFSQYKSCIHIQQPFLDLYFIPITILIGKQVNFRQLTAKIYSRFNMLHKDLQVQVFKLNSRNSTRKQKSNSNFTNNQSEYLYVKVHSSYCIIFYQIKSIQFLFKFEFQVKDYPRFDKQLLIRKYLWKFYQSNYSPKYPIKQTLSILLYWAFRKNILDHDSLMIYFFTNTGSKEIVNILPEFNKRLNQQGILEQIKKLTYVTKELNTGLKPGILLYSNFALKQKKGFYVENKSTYSKMKQIRIIPFPISKKDFIENSEIVQKYINNKCSNKIWQKGPCEIFLMITKFLNMCIKRSEKIIIDLTETKKGQTIIKNCEFQMQVIDPVFKNNLCYKLFSKESKYSQLKQSFVIDQFKAIERYCRLTDAKEKILSRIFQSSNDFIHNKY